MASLKPLHDNLIVEPVSEEEAATKAGIILPETVDKGKPEKGKVIEVGPGKVMENGQKKEMSVKVGDQVIFKKYAPDEIKIQDKEYLIISEEDILATIQE